MRLAILSSLLLIFNSTTLFGQSTYVPYNKDYYDVVDRYEIRSGKFAAGHAQGVKPYFRKAVAALTDSLFLDYDLSKSDNFNLQYLANDNWEWSERDKNNSSKKLFNFFYEKQSDLYHVDTEHFDLHVNPVFHFGLGAESGEDGLYINTRGLELRGMINRKVGFYTYFADNQMRFPTYVRDWMSDDRFVVPGQGFWKSFKTNGVDFLSARGYITWNAAKFIDFQFGHDKNFIGPGYRSLLLSDFSNSYLFLKINTKIWRINYTNLFTEMRADAPGNIGGSFGDIDYPKKYLALHRLGINITDQFNLGVYEAIIFGQDNTSNGGTAFELDYLNPIVFYRTIEQSGGSQDNAILGADFTWYFLNHFSLYGQLMFDEFLLDEVKAGDGWWANKFAWQLGLKYIDVVGIKNFDLHLETNFARPYTYAHKTTFTNYSHYRQPLAHPLGANFKEFLVVAKYQPTPRLSLIGKIISSNYGSDADSTNWGGNIQLNYLTHEQEYNNEIGQGIANDLFYGSFTASYHLKHNLFIDFKQIYRKLAIAGQEDRKTNVTSMALRFNIGQRQHEF
ncbi:MAG: hypothetical protein ACR2MX_00295 [Cyclobacteriaceae bacterium]